MSESLSLSLSWLLSPCPALRVWAAKNTRYVLHWPDVRSTQDSLSLSLSLSLFLSCLSCHSHEEDKWTDVLNTIALDTFLMESLLHFIECFNAQVTDWIQVSSVANHKELPVRLLLNVVLLQLPQHTGATHDCLCLTSTWVALMSSRERERVKVMCVSCPLVTSTVLLVRFYPSIDSCLQASLVAWIFTPIKLTCNNWLESMSKGKARGWRERERDESGKVACEFILSPV